MRELPYPRRVFAAALRLPGALGQLGTPAWLTLAIVGALAVALFTWRLSVDLAPLAGAAETKLTEFRRLSVGGLADPDGESLAELQGEVDLIEQEVISAARTMDWLARLSSALSWLPVLDYEIAAWAAQMDRLRSDVGSASTLLALSSRLVDACGDAQSVLLSPGAEASPELLTVQARDLAASFAETIEGLSEAAQAGRRRRPVFRITRVTDAMALLTEVEERMLTAFKIGQQASALLVDLLEIAEGVQPLVGQFIADDRRQDLSTAAELAATLDKLDEQLRFSLVKSRAIAKLVADSDPNDPLLEELNFLQDLQALLLTVNGATMIGLQVFGPAIQDAEASKAGLLESDGSLVSALNRLVGHESELGEAVAMLDGARQTLSDLKEGSNATQRLQGLGDLDTVVTLLHEGLHFLMSIAPIGGDLLGADSTRRYLVLGQSADELRATGGYVSSVWLMTFENGGLADLQYYDAVRVDDWERLMLYPAAPVGLEEHMDARVWLLRDVSWEPDFPTTARTAEDMFKIGQRQDVDGVVAMNQWTLLTLVQSLGSIPSPGGGDLITPRNLFSKLEQGSDEHGRAYMDVTLQGVVEKLNQQTSLPMLLRLASAMYSSLQERDLLLFLEDPETQRVIQEAGWDGRVRHDSTDYLYVVDSNVGWSKADRNIERKASYQVDMRMEPGARANLVLSYNNHSGPGSPGCEPQWLNRGTNYSQLKNACYWDYWRVYVPNGAKLRGNTLLGLPEHSVAVETRKGLPGEDTVKVSSSYNKTVFSGLFALEAQAATQVSLVYDLPSSALRREGDNIYYQLLVQKQPGIRRREVSVEIILPEGYRLASSSITPVSTVDSRVRFLMRVEQDTLLDAVFTKVDNGPN